MRKKLKTIQVPDGLISNQLRKDGMKISPKTTYLYVWIKMLLSDFKTNTLTITPKALREELQWKSNFILKNHLKALKDLGYITYQDDFDNGTLKPNKPLMIKITEIRSNFKELTEKSIKEKILVSTTDPEKALRLCYLIKCYTNEEYGYCWLTYNQIQSWGQIRRAQIETITSELTKASLMTVTKGNTIKDTTDRLRKENNKYSLLFR